MSGHILGRFWHFVIDLDMMEEYDKEEAKADERAVLAVAGQRGLAHVLGSSPKPVAGSGSKEGLGYWEGVQRQ